MTDKLKGELIRKGIHFCALAIPIGYYYMSQGKVILIMSPLTFLFILFDVLKSKSEKFRVWVNKHLGVIFRGYEKRGAFSGSSYILFGSLFAILIFPKIIAILVITFTVAGDLTAALAGMLIGQHKLIGRATIEGSVGFLAASLIATSFYPDTLASSYPPGTLSWMRLIGSFFAMFVEMLPLKIDDNLTVPILTGTLLAILARFIGAG